MPRTKAPLGERDANIASPKPSNLKQGSMHNLKEAIANATRNLSNNSNKTSPSTGQKRQHEDDHTEHSHDLTPMLGIYEVNSDESDDGIPMKWDCNQIRNRINSLIRSGEYQIGELQKALDVSPNSYRTFLAQTGPTGGMGSDTFVAANQFFLNREAHGIKRPRPKKQKVDDDKDKATTSATKKPTAKAKKEDANDKYDVSSIHLDGEDDETVPIYDTCQDLRTKIKRYLKQPSTTQVGLARLMSAASPTVSVAPQNIARFIGKSGPVAGAKMAVFYAGYVYFEKLRIKEGKKKTNKREEMEEIHGAQGMDRDFDGTESLICHVSSMPTIDQYGKLGFGPA